MNQQDTHEEPKPMTREEMVEAAKKDLAGLTTQELRDVIAHLEAKGGSQ